MSSVKWCFVALLLSGFGLAAEDNVATATAAGTVRSNGLCTAADSPAVCLFKALLKNAVLYINSRRQDTAADTAKNDVQKTDGDSGSQLQQSKGIEEFLMEQIQNILGLFSFGFELPAEVTSPWTLLKSSFFNGRGKKNKNLGPMLAAGAAVMAGTLIPIAFGALFMLAGKAIMTSLMAITISGLLGLKTLFGKHEHGHVKAYAAQTAPAQYTEAQFEQELGMYKGQTEAKMHSSSANFYGGESNLSGYYKANEQLGNGSNQPDYYAASSVPSSSKFGVGGGSNHHNHNDSNKIIVEKND